MARNTSCSSYSHSYSWPEHWNLRSVEGATNVEDAEPTLYHRQHVASCNQHDWKCFQPSDSQASSVEHGTLAAYRDTT